MKKKQSDLFLHEGLSKLEEVRGRGRMLSDEDREYILSFFYSHGAVAIAQQDGNEDIVYEDKHDDLVYRILRLYRIKCDKYARTVAKGIVKRKVNMKLLLFVSRFLRLLMPGQPTYTLCDKSVTMNDFLDYCREIYEFFVRTYGIRTGEFGNDAYRMFSFFVITQITEGPITKESSHNENCVPSQVCESQTTNTEDEIGGDVGITTTIG